MTHLPASTICSTINSLICLSNNVHCLCNNSVMILESKFIFLRRQVDMFLLYALL